MQFVIVLRENVKPMKLVATMEIEQVRSLQTFAQRQARGR
jgi:hypothetical protein